MKSRKTIVAALMVAMFLGAVEGTVVTTAIPTIVKSLSGFELISWVFSMYLLTSAISTPIYGKLADLYGRKNTLITGIIIFLIGSSLCGISQSMYQLVAFRALQGVGAGAIFTITYTIVGDIFTLSERAKVQGWISSVWGIASIAGPFIGGFLIDTLSWNWIFFINIPFGVLCIILLQKNLSENIERKRHKIDYAGTAVLSSAILIFLYSLLSGEKDSGYVLPIPIAIVITSVLLILFYFIEKKSEEPIIPFEIFTKTNTIVNGISFLASAVLIGADVYMPIYIQNVLGFGATVSGLVMAPMSVSWMMTSVILGKAIPKYGERVVIGVSMVILLSSCLLLLILGVGSSIALVIAFLFIMGFGFGGGFTTLTIVVQSSVGYNKRGAATASNSLVRTLGQTIGVSIFGSLFNAYIVKYFYSIGINGVELNNLYAQSNAGISLQDIRASIDSGLHVVYIVFVVLSLACLILSLTLPSGLKENAETKQQN